MDFIMDSLVEGRRFRCLTMVDEFTRECPVIEVDRSLPSLRVFRVWEQLAARCASTPKFPHFVNRQVPAPG
jgi:putative transposase